MVNRPNAAQAASSGHAEDAASGPVDGLPERTSTIAPNSTGSANCAPASSRLAPARIQPSRGLFAEQLKDARIEAKQGHARARGSARGPLMDQTCILIRDRRGRYSVADFLLS